MAATKPRTMTLMAFRRTDQFSGALRVVPGSRTRKGVRRHSGRASCNSLKGLAGTDAPGGTAAGESAHTSAAHAADCSTDADLAGSIAENDVRTPTKKRPKSKGKHAAAKTGGGGEVGPVEALWEEKAELDGGEILPEDGIGFVEAVNEHINLVKLTELLLRGADEKSCKSLLGQLLDIRYGKNARLAAAARDEGPDKLTWNLPR